MRSTNNFSQQRQQLADPEMTFGAGDSRVVYDLLSPDLGETAYDQLIKQVEWVKMYHRGKCHFVLLIYTYLSYLGGEVPRLVAQQGEISDTDGR